jgi:hypothetical protein
MSDPRVVELALARARAAERVEAAIVALGGAYEVFGRATRALEACAEVDLGHYLDAPITMHLAQAGLGALLERKLTDKPAPLRELVEGQHRKLLRIDTTRV